MMPSLSQSRHVEKPGALVAEFFPTPEKSRGCVTHLSIGRYNILFHTAETDGFFSTPFRPLRGIPRPFSRRFAPVPAKSEPPTQPLPRYPSSIDASSPAPDSSRASPRIASLLLAHIVDKLQVLPHHSDSIPGVSVVNGLQHSPYASNSQG